VLWVWQRALRAVGGEEYRHEGRLLIARVECPYCNPAVWVLCAKVERRNAGRMNVCSVLLCARGVVNLELIVSSCSSGLTSASRSSGFDSETDTADADFTVSAVACVEGPAMGSAISLPLYDITSV
jgi:hypothetical protein